MAKIHMVLQGKGGIGKSVIATLLAQYKQSKHTPLTCIDTDPINPTFAGFQSLNVQRLNIIKNNEVDPRCFDALIQRILDSDTDFVIDNGVSAFLPLSNYTVQHNIPAVLKKHGHQLTVHTVITGGPTLIDTLSGFSQLITQFSDDTRFVVWLNPFWGPVEHKGKPFDDMKAYKDNEQRITAIIRLPDMGIFFRQNFIEMLENKNTFADVIDSNAEVFTRQRLVMIRRDVYDQLDCCQSFIAVF